MILHFDLVDEVSAELDSLVHIHAVQFSRETLTDLLDVFLQIAEGQSGFGLPGKLFKRFLIGLKSLFDTLAANGEFFKLKCLVLVGIEQSLLLSFGVANPASERLDLFCGKRAVER